MSEIRFHCGFCGSPLDEKGNPIFPVPEGYNPDDYDAAACYSCAMEDESRHHIIVTREMAMDAEDPSLEGSVW